MRVCFLTHYYPPEPGAPQARIGALARSLARRGIRVTVHTGFPHYPEGRIVRPYANRAWSVEHDDGVRVVRSVVLPLPNRGTATRLADHAAFAVGARATQRVAGRQDVVVAESPPLLLAGAAVGYARSARARLILNVADLWPASAVVLGVVSSPRLISVAERIETFAYGHAAAITTPTAGLERALNDHPAARDRIVRIPPVVDIGRLPGADATVPRRTGPLRVLYAGTVGLAQGLGTLVEAARLAGPEVVDVTIAGSGADAGAVRERVAGERISNVHLRGVVAPGQIGSLYAETEAVAVLLRDIPLLSGALPTKLVEGMLAGRAVVFSGEGEAGEHVSRSGGGLVVAPEDPRALADAFAELLSRREQLSELGRRGRRYADATLGPEAAIGLWANLLVRVASGEALSAQHVVQGVDHDVDGRVVHRRVERQAEKPLRQR